MISICNREKVMAEMDGIGRNRLALREAPIPKPGRGEVLVKGTAVSLNYRDKAAGS